MWSARLLGVYRERVSGLQARRRGENLVETLGESENSKLRPQVLRIRDFLFYPGLLGPAEQAALVEDLRGVIAGACHAGYRIFNRGLPVDRKDLG